MGRIFDSPTQLIVIILLVILLFGSKKMPDMARGIGRSLRIFKSEVDELRKESSSHPSQSSNAGGEPHNDDSTDNHARTDNHAQGNGAQGNDAGGPLSSNNSPPTDSLSNKPHNKDSSNTDS